MIDKAPLISVITIFLNAEAYIEQAIDSVFAQSFDRWELLLVDDGSTDASSAIARRKAAEHPDRVRYLDHAGHVNRGMSASRNVGIAHAKGEFIAFLDSDDIWLPLRLERHFQVLVSAPDVAMVYGPALYWHSWSGNPRDQQRDFVRPLHVETGVRIDPPELMRVFLRTGGAALPGICSLLVRRETVLRAGCFNDAFRGAFEDQVFLAKLALTARVVVIAEYLDKYRQHDASYSSMAVVAREYDPKRPNQARRRFLEWLEAYLRDNGVGDAQLWYSLRRELRPYRHPLLYTVLSMPRMAVGHACRTLKSALRLARK